MLWGNRKIPAALVLVAIGAAYALVWKLDLAALGAGLGFRLPTPRAPSGGEIWTGFVLLAVTQLPLSLSNSVIATAQTTRDLFPDRAVSVRRIGLTYATFNLVAPFFSGIPVCHGCGGLAGHYAFGGRTGGSPVIYGALFLTIGLACSGAFSQAVAVFPAPILGVLLVFEGVALARLTRGVAGDPRQFLIALLVGVIALGLPKQGFLVGLLVGVALYYLWRPATLGPDDAPLDPGSRRS